MRFQHPVNGYVEHCSVPFLWALLFGPLYFVLKGIWRHVVLYFVVNSILFGVMGILAAVSASLGPIILIKLNITNPDAIANAWLAIGAATVFCLVLPFLVYPLIANGIVRRHFLRQGWVEVE